jgi:hypothetical protein
MKNLFLLIVMFISIISFSQKLIINVFEMQSSYIHDYLTTNSVRNLKVTSNETKVPVDGSYIINLNTNTLIFLDQSVEYEYPIKVTKLSDNKMQIQILDTDWNVGLIVNTDLKNESILWYNILDVITEITIFSKFEIVKSI